jgi:hypothetical protein
MYRDGFVEQTRRTGTGKTGKCQDSRKKDLHGNVSAWVDGRIRQVMPWFLAIAIDDFYRATFVARYGRPWTEEENGERLCCNIRKWRSLT